MADDPHYQSIKRAIIRPSFDDKTPEASISSLQQAYSQLAQEVIFCHNRIYVDQIAVGGGVGVLAVALPAAYPDTFYTPLAILDWAAYAYITAFAATGFTLTFSAASPGGGGTVRIFVIR